MSLVLGIDGSSSCSGVALARDGDIVHTSRWKPRGRENRKGEYVLKMVSYRDWLRREIRDLELEHGKIDEALVELASNVRGPGGRPTSRTTLRVLARWEAITMVVCHDAGIPIRELEVSSARSTVLAWRLPQGERKLNKEKANVMVRTLFPHHEFADDNECDAALMALVPTFEDV